MKQIFIPLVLIAISFYSCSKSNSANCNYDPCAIKAPDTEIQNLKDTLAKDGISLGNLTQQCSGMLYHIVDTGTGATATICKSVNVTYIAKINDTTNVNLYDSTTTTFPLGSLITSWKNGITLLKPGGRILIYSPPTLAYGQWGNGPIPGNAYLYFDIRLNSIQ
jgi:FKBP-type peptidyl-prolyl cis-trans isomerase FkpA